MFYRKKMLLKRLNSWQRSFCVKLSKWVLFNASNVVRPSTWYWLWWTVSFSNRLGAKKVKHSPLYASHVRYGMIKKGGLNCRMIELYSSLWISKRVLQKWLNSGSGYPKFNCIDMPENRYKSIYVIKHCCLCTRRFGQRSLQAKDYSVIAGAAHDCIIALMHARAVYKCNFFQASPCMRLRPQRANIS